jgi:uncharacterized protein YjbI with pentapeptide repeats
MRVARFLAWSAGVAGAVAVLAVAITIIYGFVAYTPKKPGWVGVADKTLWDWLDLLIIPFVIAVVVSLVGYFFTRSENRVALAVSEKRSQDETLQTYLNQIGERLLDTEQPLRELKEEAELLTLARAQTWTVLKRLDASHNRSLLTFLRSSQLVHVLLRSDLGDADLSGADLRDTDLSSTNLSRIILRSANLKGADLSNVNFRDADLRNADLSSADFTRATLHNADLSGADLSGADLTRAVLHNADLTRATLRNANLLWASLRSINLSDADLTYARLNRADLHGVNLSRGSLFSLRPTRNVRLRRAMLSNADLRNADLSGARLRCVDLFFADLSGVDLSNAKIDERQLAWAKSLKGATMPDGQKYEDWLKSKGRGEDGENSGPS